MKNINAIKLVGLAATVLGAVATIVSGMVNDKKMEHEIACEVAKAIAERE